MSRAAQCDDVARTRTAHTCDEQWRHTGSGRHARVEFLTPQKSDSKRIYHRRAATSAPADKLTHIFRGPRAGQLRMQRTYHHTTTTNAPTRDSGVRARDIPGIVHFGVARVNAQTHVHKHNAQVRTIGEFRRQFITHARIFL